MATKDDVMRLIDAWECLGLGTWPQLVCRKGRVDQIFVWGRADGETPDVLPLAADLYHQTGAPIVVPGYVGKQKGQGAKGYPGPQFWHDVLRHNDVPSTSLYATSGAAELQHTASEFDEFIDWLSPKPNQEHVVLAVTKVTHALRAMLGVVQSLRRKSLQDVIVLPVWSEQLDFTARPYGSQGQGPLSNWEWLAEEIKRLPIYQKKGDLASLNELVEYFLFARRRLDGKYPSVKQQLQHYLRESGLAIAKAIK